MGSPDQMQPVRKAMMAALKQSAAMTALVPAASIYHGTVPADRTKPFIRRGAAIASPFRASGLDSSAFRISFQGFSHGVPDGADRIIVLAEDHIDAIGSAMKETLDGAVLALPGGANARVQWIQTTPSIDPSETQAWMTTVTFGVEVSG